MNRKFYNILIGSFILIGLYFEVKEILYALIAILLFEAVTDILIPKYLTRIPYTFLNDTLESELSESPPCRFNFKADRMWRICMALVLIVSYVIFFNHLWFLPWFLGFAILGAGISNVCPMLEILRYAGFKK